MSTKNGVPKSPTVTPTLVSFLPPPLPLLLDDVASGDFEHEVKHKAAPPRTAAAERKGEANIFIMDLGSC